MPIVGIDHVQVAAPRGGESEAKARAFYGELLGLQEIEKPDNLKLNGGVWFSTGTGQLHIGLEEPFSPARKAHPAFIVDDLQQLRSRLHDAGISLTEANDIPGVDRFHVHDPFGNRLELMARS